MRDISIPKSVTHQVRRSTINHFTDLFLATSALVDSDYSASRRRLRKRLNPSPTGSGPVRYGSCSGVNGALPLVRQVGCVGGYRERGDGRRRWNGPLGSSTTRCLDCRCVNGSREPFAPGRSIQAHSLPRTHLITEAPWVQFGPDGGRTLRIRQEPGRSFQMG